MRRIICVALALLTSSAIAARGDELRDDLAARQLLTM
jgi:hypothetical protein